MSACTDGSNKFVQPGAKNVQPRLVVIGASLGGLHALHELLGALPPSFPCPIVIVQHRHKDSDTLLRDVLQRATALPIYEVVDKAPLERGIFLAPPDYHVLVEDGALALSIDGPVNHARPSIDVLFESAAAQYGSGVIGVLLTGASADGARGMAAIAARGGVSIVQDPADAECAMMPSAALALTVVDQVLPLHDIGPALQHLSGDKPKHSYE